MSLIGDSKRASAQEPKPRPPANPKPAKAAPKQQLAQDVQLPEMTQQPEQAFQANFSLPAEAEPQAAPQEFLAPGAPPPTLAQTAAFATDDGTPIRPLTSYLGGALGNRPEVVMPEAPAAVTPPINLWRDAVKDLGTPDLNSGNLVTTAFPTSYGRTLTSFDPGVNRSFSSAASSRIAADDAARNQAAALANDLVNRRGAQPNTPDVTKPWFQQQWGWLQDAFLGNSAQQRRAEDQGEVNPFAGQFGRYGSGLGGALKTAFGVPIAGANALATEGMGRIGYLREQAIANFTNPKLPSGRNFRNASSDEQNAYLTTKVGDNFLFPGSGRIVQFNPDRIDFRKPLGSFVKDALTLQTYDSIADANPTLKPVIDPRTGKPAQVRAAAGAFRATNKRPGQEWYEDPGSATLDIANQLFSPGNKVDFAGDLVGRVVGSGIRRLGRTSAGRAVTGAVGSATRPLRNAAGSAVNNLLNIGKPAVSAPLSAPTLLQPVPVRGVASIPTPPPLLAPISRPTAVLALPSAPRGGNTQLAPIVKPAVVPDVPNVKPQQTALVPKTDPEGVAVVVGIGQKGEPLQFVPSVERRAYDEFIGNIRKEFTTETYSYKGNSWQEWDEWLEANEVNFRQAQAVGAALPKPKDTPLLPARAASTADLAEQARVVAEQKLSLDEPLKQLEELFDETVDMGRRELQDSLPTRQLTVDDIQRALDYNAPIRLAKEAEVPPYIREVLRKGVAEDIARALPTEEAAEAVVRANNTALVKVEPRVLPETAATVAVAQDAPKEVFHGTALAEWQPYNVVEGGSRGELGTGLYTTSSVEEAAFYSQAVVGNNRSVDVAYEPLAPQVVTLKTEVVAPLDARATLPTDTGVVKAVVDFLPPDLRPELPAQASFVEVTEAIEQAVARAGGSEELLQQAGESISDGVRASGYDAVYDRNSGWLNVVDNGKAQVTSSRSLPQPSAIEAAVARYNADTTAAGHYSKHLTSDANLRDSAYQVLDQSKELLEEAHADVVRELSERVANAPDKPVVDVFLDLKAAAKEPPSVERYTRDIQVFGQPLHPVLVAENRFGNLEVVGNEAAYDAAFLAHDQGYLQQVAAVVISTRKKSTLQPGLQLIGFKGLRKGQPVALASDKAAVTKELAKFGTTSAPPVLEATAFGTYRILDRSFAANAYAKANLPMEAVVVREGKAALEKVEVALVEGKKKPLEAPVPSLETLAQPKPQAAVSSPAKAAVAPAEPTITTEGLAQLSFKELRAFAATKGIKGRSRAELEERLFDSVGSTKLAPEPQLPEPPVRTVEEQLFVEPTRATLVDEQMEKYGTLQTLPVVRENKDYTYTVEEGSDIVADYGKWYNKDKRKYEMIPASVVTKTGEVKYMLVDYKDLQSPKEFTESSVNPNASIDDMLEDARNTPDDYPCY